MVTNSVVDNLHTALTKHQNNLKFSQAGALRQFLVIHQLTANR